VTGHDKLGSKIVASVRNMRHRLGSFSVIHDTMDAEPVPGTPDDSPALAKAIVIHAQRLCETADHFWRVLPTVSVPVAPLTDNRQQHNVTYDTESIE
jgi:hypothetical protein